MLMPLARRGTSTGLLQSDHSIKISPSTCTRTTQRHAVMATEAEATRSRQKTIKPKYMSFSFAQGRRACGGALSMCLLCVVLRVASMRFCCLFCGRVYMGQVGCVWQTCLKHILRAPPQALCPRANEKAEQGEKFSSSPGVSHTHTTQVHLAELDLVLPQPFQDPLCAPIFRQTPHHQRCSSIFQLTSLQGAVHVLRKPRSCLNPSPAPLNITEPYNLRSLTN